MSTIRKLMRKAKMSAEIADEVAEMVYSDLQLMMSAEELVMKVQLIRSLYSMIIALCRRFGEVHLEQR